MAYSLENTTDLIALGDAIRSKTGTSEQMTVSEMAEAVEGLGGLQPRSVNIYEDDLSRSLFSAFPEMYQNITKFVLNGTIGGSFFKNKTNSDMANFPPIEISSGAYVSCLSMFLNNPWLKNVSITANGSFYITAINNMFYDCIALKTFDFSFLQYANDTTLSNMSQIFYNCQSLRTITNLEQLEHLNTTGFTNVANTVYRNCFFQCTCLDKIENMPVIPFNWTSTTSQGFSGFLQDCSHLSKFTFNLRNDIPQVVNWQNQTIDLSLNIGYGDYYALGSRLGYDKEVTDAASYNALKNDPDWWTTDVNYSRYNHDSAVETINSLPDVSAQTNPCIIKFKGVSGTYTDGGPISALTAEEIAVATNKGWTVTIV